MMEVYQFYLTPEEVEDINKGNRDDLLFAWRAARDGDKEAVERHTEKYRHVATLPNCDDLQEAFRLMNLWERPCEVLPHVVNPASMSVGDLIYWREQWYICCTIGFEPINVKM